MGVGLLRFWLGGSSFLSACPDSAECMGRNIQTGYSSPSVCLSFL